VKKLFSSVFIVLILLNVMGYYGIFAGLQYSNSREMMRQFDAGTYNPEHVRTFKVYFPSNTNSENFERIDGEFEKNGEVYRLVKQRLFRDTFHIVYIKDITGTAIRNAMNDCAKTFSEQTSDEDSNTVLPIFIKEYLTRPFFIDHISFGYQQAVRKESYTPVFIGSFISSIVHPPERS
jgi:hypothetical protein